MKINELPLVSIVLLNWNGQKYIADCVKSVKEQTYKNIQLILVDNNSTDESNDIAKGVYPDLIFHPSKTNLGFTGGMNLGISLSNGKYVLLLNNDVYLHQDYVKCCVEFLEKQENVSVGCVAGPEYIWTNNELTSEIALGGGMVVRCRMQLVEDRPMDQESLCFGVSGSFPFFRKKSMDDLINISGHFFDEDFETGWEDTDVRFRLFFRGWDTFFIPGAKAWHVGSASDKENKPLISKNHAYQIRIFRNRRFVIGKNIHNRFFLWSVFLAFLEVVLFFYYLIKAPKSAYCLVVGNIKAIKKRSSIKEKRAHIMDNLKIPIEKLNEYIKGV